MPEVEAKAETPEIKVVPAPPPPAPPAPPAPKQKHGLTSPFLRFGSLLLAKLCILDWRWMHLRTDSALLVRQPAESYVVKVSKDSQREQRL